MENENLNVVDWEVRKDISGIEGRYEKKLGVGVKTYRLPGGSGTRL